MSEKSISKERNSSCDKFVYRNIGNALVLSLVPLSARRILDVGCGAGDNARKLRERDPDAFIVGITFSESEAMLASAYCNEVQVLDLECDEITLEDEVFDTILLSHILEHLRDPVGILEKLVSLVKPGGIIIIAVPNVLEWRTRVSLLRGHFNYADHGILDRTHLKFFTYLTAARELVEPVKDLQLLRTIARGAIPLGPLRRYLFSSALCQRIDTFAVQRWPNLFAGEIAMLAKKREDV